MTDIQIAQSVEPQHIGKIAKDLNLPEDQIEFLGTDKAKLPLSLIDEEKIAKSNLILVTAISPTPAGEGKTTSAIGLADAMNIIGKKAILALREPSLGPVFGIKGGAAGGGWSQVIPMDDINLHFTGDFHAIEKANNLLSALIDNNIQSKTRSIGIDPRTVIWKRCIDMNDRGLRNVVAALGGKSGGVPRETGFDITAASEIMAILCLSKDLDDLKERCGNIYIGDKWTGEPVYAKTQKSLSDDEKKLGRPEHFDIHIREFEFAAGAGFIIPIAGNIMRMPGLPATPAAENIDIDQDGNISGLF